MAHHPDDIELPVASSSAAAAVEPSSDNPVVAVAQKAKSAVKKHVARPRPESRPSVRLLHEPSAATTQPNQSTRRSLDVIPDETITAPRQTGFRSLFSKKDGKPKRVGEKDGLPRLIEENGRQRLMVPKRVADELAPHIAAHEDPRAVVEHFAAHSQAVAAAEKQDAQQNAGEGGGRLSKLLSRVKGSDNDAFTPTIHANNSNEMGSDMVDLLDVVDPQVSTLSTLTNVQNSLFIPSLGRVVNRRPAYKLTTDAEDLRRLHKMKASLKEASSTMKERAKREINDLLGRPQPERVSSISSNMTESHFAVLHHGESLEGWTAEEKEELDDLVRHALHSRRAKFKRAMKGFGQYVRRPLGLFVTVYATLITIFGAAWVLFLIGWISLGSRRDYIINVVDNVLVALFAVIGDGLAPFRAVDTYHMIYIAHYYHKTWKLRRRLGLPDLIDHNDLPEAREEQIRANIDIESFAGRGTLRRMSTGSVGGEYSVLTEAQQAKLEHHERKFSKSHTFYKPHETATHYAFPLRLLIAVVVLLDCHSLLQISLGACTWGIPYQSRPFALTTVILCCSITCNIMGGILISVGDRRTRKTEVLELMMRRELTSEAMEKIHKRRMKEAEELGVIDRAARKKAEEEMEAAENEEIKRQWKEVPLLPKKLLGKGHHDSREPALPRKQRKGSKRPSEMEGKGKSTVASSASSQTSKPTLVSRLGLAANPSQPQTDHVDYAQSQPQGAAGTSSSNAPGTRARIMKVIRRADMDMS